MNRSTDAQQLWDALLMAHPRRTRFTLQHLLGTFQQVFEVDPKCWTTEPRN